MAEKRKVAIVGSEKKYLTPSQETKAEFAIYDILRKEGAYLGPNWIDQIILVSGGCPNEGIDKLAEKVATAWKIEKEIHNPGINQWEDGIGKEPYDYDDHGVNIIKYRQVILKGYKSRNIDIANSCHVLYCIDPKGRNWSGGKYTMMVAKRLGKEVHLIEIE